jgi:Na+/H+-dicarboxylate symporter
MIAVCIFGAAATVVAPDRRRAVVEFFTAVNDLAMVVIGWLMKLAPAAVFVLIAAVVARTGAGVLQVLVRYAAVVVGALLVHAALLTMVVRVAAGRSVSGFLRGVSDALLLAFSTASSNATLPVSMAAATTRLGIPPAIVGFVLPAGATLNKNGSAIYKAITAVFVAELCGLSVGPGEMATIVLASTLAAFAGTGVPGSSLVTTLIVLNAIGLGSRAAAAVALVASIDRPLDMCRTTVNTLGNLVGATVIGRST